MINQNEIEEAAKYFCTQDGYTEKSIGLRQAKFLFVSGANWAINLLKERSGKGFDAFWDDFGARQECIGNSDRYCDVKDGWQAATLSVESSHSEELKKLEDRIEKLREALDIVCDSSELRGLNAEHLRGAIALDDQLKEGK